MPRRTDWRKDQGATPKPKRTPICHICFRGATARNPVEWAPRMRQRVHRNMCPKPSET